MGFFNKDILTKLRNRSFIESSTEPGDIKSEGAWRITIFNCGNADLFIADGAGNVKTIEALPGQATELNFIVLDGEPYITRDDELTYTFGAGNDPHMEVIYDRLVNKVSDNNYPLDDLLNKQ